jgi:NAD(P)H dehydrogenase (quinone)
MAIIRSVPFYIPLYCVIHLVTARPEGRPVEAKYNSGAPDSSVRARLSSTASRTTVIRMTGTQKSDHSPSGPKHVVVLSHPDADSFNMAVAQAYCEAVRGLGHQAVLRDLYRMGFDPVLKARERPTAPDFALSPDVAAELEAIGGADVFVLVYPIWFGTPPAMMKGYVERVLGAGFSLQSVRTHALSTLLGGKQLLSFTSSGAPQQWLTDQDALVSLRTVFDGYLARAFSMASPDHVHFDSVGDDLDKRAAEEKLGQVKARARQMCHDIEAQLAKRRQ